MTRVAFDESGNSGANLLDGEQPVFALASVLDSSEMASVVAGDRELKFSRLRRSRPGRDRILRILNHEVFQPEQYFVSAFHKRFLVVVNIVDLLYEPLAHTNGINLYERGANLAMANMLYAVLPQFIGPELFESMLIQFVAMVREPIRTNIDGFYEVVHRAYEASSEADLKAELGALMVTRALVEADADSFHSGVIDPAVPAFALHASKWTSRLQRAFDIIHDDSKPIQNEQLVLEAMMSVTEPAAPIGYDRRKMHFPLSASGITFRSSELEPSIQLADVVASAVAYVQRSTILRDNDTFAAELRKTRVFAGEFHPVWPTLKISPSELGTDEPAPLIDPHNYVGGYVDKRLGGIPPAGLRRKPSGRTG